jgi:hypothetical protein
MIRRRTAGKLVAGLILSIMISLMLTCGAELSRGETTSDLPRVVRELILRENPNASLVGQVVSGGVVYDDHGRAATALRIHPIGMPLLFTDTPLVLCGDISEQVSTPDGRIIQGDLVFIYRRQASRLIDDVPCYDLRNVYPILTKKRTFNK